MISQVRYAAAREPSRYMINGVHVVVADGRLSLVATDGRRLATSETVDTGGGVNAAETVPLSAMEALRVSIAKGDDRASIEFDTTMVRFCWGSNVLVSQLLESRFPDYAAVIPKKADVSATVDRAELVDVIKRLKVHADSDLPLMSFDACPDRLSVVIESAAGGSGSATLTPTGKGIGTGQIGFNPGYVLDALKASDSADVTVSFTDAASPATFELGFRYVLMPIQRD
jgi:DNA polymerase-3 subunit beta